MPDRATVTFHTTPETKARLDRLARATQRSKSFLTNAAVERYLAEEEAFVTAVEEGLAQAEAGHVVDHDKASAFIRSLATGARVARPEPDRS